MPIIIYEDPGWEKLQPLSLTRPVWELKCGITALADKLALLAGEDTLGYTCRDYLAPLAKQLRPGAHVNETPQGKTLFLNGRALIDNPAPLLEYNGEAAYFCEEELVAALMDNPITAAGVIDPSKLAEGLPRREIEAEIIEYPWDLVDKTHTWIERDLKRMKGIRQINPVEYAPQGVHIVSGAGVFAEGEVSLSPGVVLDSSEGPILLGKGMKIMPNAAVIGPAAIGEGSLLKIGAKIYPGTSIGPICKVGGEVEESVIHGYSNKQHEGFLGHAYIGQWCNLGAGTENSDLKNNYTPVKVQIGERRVNSGKIFVGLFMGDHSKTGINTTFNTGSVVGVAAMAYGPGFQPRFIPSFHWSDGKQLIRSDHGDAILIAHKVMNRRGESLSKEEAAALKRVYDDVMRKKK